MCGNRRLDPGSDPEPSDESNPESSEWKEEEGGLLSLAAFDLDSH